jgi:hypothetical protein
MIQNLSKLPLEVVQIIFEYDNTFRVYFTNRVLKELVIDFFIQNQKEDLKTTLLEIRDPTISSIGQHWFYIGDTFNDEHYLIDVASRSSFRTWCSKEKLLEMEYAKVWQNEVLFNPNKSWVNASKLIRYHHITRALWFIEDYFGLTENVDSDENEQE